jgi:hypothetical protein
MPVNAFSRQAVNNSVNQGMGFNLQNMIQQGQGQVMQDVEERRQMGRRKYAADILSQTMQQQMMDLANQKADLENSQGRYHFGQEQDYWGRPGQPGMLQTPEGQAQERAYSERLGVPQEGPITNPYQMERHTQQGEQIGKGEDVNKQIAMHILSTSMMWPQGGVEPPEVQWARRILNVNQGAPEPGSHEPAVAPSQPPRSAWGVGVHEALPGLVGAGAGGAAMAFTPGPPVVKGLAGLAGMGLGAGMTSTALDPLPESDLQAHPTAARMGRMVSMAAPLVVGGAQMLKGKLGGMKPTQPAPAGMSTAGEAGGAATVAEPPMSRMTRGPASDQPRVSQPGTVLPMEKGAQPEAAPRKPISYPMASVVGRRGRQMPGKGPGGSPLATPVSKRGRGVPQAPPVQAPGMVPPVPPGQRGYGQGDPEINAALAQFFQQQGRVPTPQEMAQLLFRR